MLRKRNIIETINDQFKNIGDLEYSRHRSSTSYLSNIITSRMTHSYPDKNRLSI
ncbi:transposase [Methylobacter luteus]